MTKRARSSRSAAARRRSGSLSPRPRVPAPARRSLGGGGSPSVSAHTVSQLGYKARKIARSEGRSYSTASGDWHLRYDLAGNRDESRAYMMDNALYRGVVDRAVDNVIRDGFNLQVQTDDRAFNAQAEGLRREAHKRPEIRGNICGLQAERMVCKDVIVAGDMGVAFIEEGRELAQFQLVESERITDGRNGTGVTVDRLGRIRLYRVADYTPAGQISSAKFVEHTPQTMSLVVNPERISQTRGAPALVAAFPYVNRTEDVCASEALAMQVLSRLAFAVTDEDAKTNAYATSRADGDAQNTTERFDWSQRLHDLGSALVFHGKPGSKVEGITRNIPGEMFVPAVRMFLRIMGLPLGLPLELVLLDWSQTNYSSARAALEQAFTHFLLWQQVMENLFYDPVLNWQLDQWMADKKLPPYPGGGAAVPRTWVRPPFIWLDHLKEAQSWGVKMDRGLVTHTEACKAAGRDRGELNAKRKQEFDEAMKLAAELMRKYPGMDVDWRLFAGLLPLEDSAPIENPARKSKQPRKSPDGSEPPTGGSGEEPPAGSEE